MKKRLFILPVCGVMLLAAACSTSSSSDATTAAAPAASSDGEEAAETTAAGLILGEDYPTEDITLINSSSAGSPADIMARQIAQSIEELYGVTVTVENVTGGSGANMFAEVMNRDADGYTIGTVTASQIAALCGGLDEQFPLDTFAFVANVQTDPYCLTVRGDSPYETLQDFIDAAKESNLLISGQGTGSAMHLSALQLAKEADFSFTWLPTEGGSDTVANLLGGNCDAGFAAPTTVNQYVKSGDLNMLAITGEEAVSSAEGVPLFSDEGYPLIMTQYRGFYVNSETDPAICQAISDMMREASQTDSFKQYMADQMLDDGYMNMQEFTDYALADYDAINELSSQLLQ